MTFNEANTVEAFIRDLLCGGITDHTPSGPARSPHNDQSLASAGTTCPTMTSLANLRKHSSRTTFARRSSA